MYDYEQIRMKLKKKLTQEHASAIERILDPDYDPPPPGAFINESIDLLTNPNNEAITYLLRLIEAQAHEIRRLTKITDGLVEQLAELRKSRGKTNS